MCWVSACRCGSGMGGLGRLHGGQGTPARRRSPQELHRGGSNHGIRRPEPDDLALGRSRGGRSSKTHFSVDRRDRSLSVGLTPGAGRRQPPAPAADRRHPPRRPRQRRTCPVPPGLLIADKADSHPATCEALRRSGSRVVIPEKSDQIAHRLQKEKPWWTATPPRRRAVPRPQRRRACLEPPQGLASSRHQVRQARPQLPSRSHAPPHRPVVGARRRRSIRRSPVSFVGLDGSPGSSRAVLPPYRL